MLRFLYRSVLRAHPPYFRDRFADEMQSIFDHTASPVEGAGLLVEAMISLVRQWTLRPQFWEKPALAAAADGTPLFYTLGSPKPRTAALVYGALLSGLVLNGVCWTMGYAWNHPRFMDIRPGYGPAGRIPESMLHSRPTRHAMHPAEPPLFTDQGQVLLVFKSPAHAAARIPTETKPSPPPSQTGTNPRSSSEEPTVAPAEIPAAQANVRSENQPAAVLGAYAGTYVNSATDTRVKIAVHGGQLELELPGQFRSGLAPIPRTQLLSCGVGDCWVTFGVGANGTIDRIEVHYGGREIVAYRQ